MSHDSEDKNPGTVIRSILGATFLLFLIAVFAPDNYGMSMAAPFLVAAILLVPYLFYLALTFHPTTRRGQTRKWAIHTQTLVGIILCWIVLCPLTLLVYHLVGIGDTVDLLLTKTNPLLAQTPFFHTEEEHLTDADGNYITGPDGEPLPAPYFEDPKPSSVSSSATF